MAVAPNCEVVVSAPQGRELVRHGTALFPLACYNEDLTRYSVPWHWHDDFEYILAAEGRVNVGAAQTHLCLAPGQGVFINSGVLHEVAFADRGPSRLHSGVFHARLVGGSDTLFWQNCAAPLLAPGAPAFFLLDGNAPWHAEVLACLRDVWQAVSAETPDYENFARYRLTGALRLLSSHLPAPRELSAPQQEAAQRAKQMLRFIEQHYTEPLSVARLAASVSLSESACLRTFRQQLGTTPIQYLKQYRIEKAGQQLLATHRKAGEIGTACGFGDLSYFTKSFRELKGCTPAEYRRRFGGKQEP